jgi:hypothetical protein
MKKYKLEDFEEMDDNALEVLIAQKSKQFIRKIEKALVGESIVAFGKNSKGIWGKNQEELTFEIQKVTLYGSYAYHNESKKEIAMAINIKLKNYNCKENYGLMYTDEKALKSLQKLMNNISPKYKLDWSESGMQPDKEINLDFSVPIKDIFPEFNIYLNYKEEKAKIAKKYQKLM